MALPPAVAADLRAPDASDAALAENLPPTGLAVIAGNVRLRGDEAHRLKVGQTVFADDVLPRVYVDRKLLYSARLGSQGTNKAIQIEKITSPKQADDAGPGG